MRPGRLADGLDHGVDAVGQAGAGLEGLVGAELAGEVALALLAAGRPDAEAAGAGERDRGAGDAAAGALDEDRLPGLQAASG